MTQHNLEDFATVMAKFEERMSIFEAELQKNLKNTNTATPTLVSLASELISFKQLAFTTMNAFRLQNERLTRDIDNIEMRSRRKMILLHGVVEQKSEDTAQVVLATINSELKLDEFTATDIRRCHRMGQSSNTQKPRPILIKFEQVAVRDKVWFSKTKLKGSGKTVSEFLTRSRHEIFMAARDRFGISKSWTRNGSIIVLDADGTQHSIASLGELNQLQGDMHKPSTSAKPTATKSKRTAAAKK